MANYDFYASGLTGGANSVAVGSPPHPLASVGFDCSERFVFVFVMFYLSCCVSVAAVALLLFSSSARAS
jgi:hypothetical protein